MKTRTSIIALLAAAALVAVGCGGASDETDGGDSAAAGGDGSKGTLSLVAYSTPQVVYDEIIPDFTATPAGEGVEFKTSFGASGDQSRAVEAGQAADVVTFSTEPDMTRLVDAGLVEPTWKDGPNEGLVTTSVVSFVVREGNPKNIKTWDDLLKPGVEVLTPNPFSSGAAKWNLLAGYGYASDGGKNPEAGLDYVRKLITEHVKVQDKSGREALQNFIGGNGDVLLSYEYEAITANKNGEKLEYVAVAADEVLQRLTARLVLHLHVLGDELGEVLQAGLRVLAAVRGVAVAAEQVPLRRARAERVRREHLDARLEQVVPGLDVLRIALAHDERDDRGGDEAVVRPVLPRRLDQPGVDQARHVRLGRERHDVGGLAGLDGARLVAGRAERRLELEPLPSGVAVKSGMISSYTTCGVEYATSESDPFEPSPPDAACAPPFSSEAPPQPATATAAAASKAMIELLVFTTSSKVGKPNRVGGEYKVLQRLDRVYRPMRFVGTSWRRNPPQRPRGSTGHGLRLNGRAPAGGLA